MVGKMGSEMVRNLAAVRSALAQLPHGAVRVDDSEVSSLADDAEAALDAIERLVLGHERGWTLTKGRRAIRRSLTAAAPSPKGEPT